jgi:hypothetical protein
MKINIIVSADYHLWFIGWNTVLCIRITLAKYRLLQLIWLSSLELLHDCKGRCDGQCMMFFPFRFVHMGICILSCTRIRPSVSYYRVSQKKVMPFVIQICRELLVVEIWQFPWVQLTERSSGRHCKVSNSSTINERSMQISIVLWISAR